MNPHLQPGPLLQPGEPRYEQLAAAFRENDEEKLKAIVHPLARLLPMIPDQQRATLRTSLSTGQNHAVIFHQAKLLDGRNRTRELTELRKPISTALFIGTNYEALELVKAENIERRHLNESQRADFAARVAMLPVGANQHTKVTPIGAPSLPFEGESAEEPAPQTLISQSEAAEMFNVSHRSVQRAAKYQKDGVPELAEAVQAGTLAVSVAAEIAERPAEEQTAILAKLPRNEEGKLTPEAKKEIRKAAKEVRVEDQAEKKRKRDEKEKKLGDKQRQLEPGKAGLILSDFEWHFKVRSEETGMDRHASNHYVTAREATTPEAIVERQRERMLVAAEDCIHLMWCPASFSAIAHKVMELQGFTYVSQFVWVKPSIGTGFWVRDKHELLLIGVKGKIPCPAMGDQFDSAIEAAKGEHSEKPDFQYEIAEHYFPNLPKVELNARRPRKGWLQWGNQLPEPEQPTLSLETSEAAE